jgi:hypothetical protein
MLADHNLTTAQTKDEPRRLADQVGAGPSGTEQAVLYRAAGLELDCRAISHIIAGLIDEPNSLR